MSDNDEEEATEEEVVTEEDAVIETANGERYAALEINKSGETSDE